MKKLINNIKYRFWLNKRNQSIDEYGQKLCYCGHTDMCSCSNPDKSLFLQQLKLKNVNINKKL